MMSKEQGTEEWVIEKIDFIAWLFRNCEVKPPENQSDFRIIVPYFSALAYRDEIMGIPVLIGDTAGNDFILCVGLHNNRFLNYFNKLKMELE